MHLDITCVWFIVNNYIDKVSGGSLQIYNVNSTVNNVQYFDRRSSLHKCVGKPMEIVEMKYK